MPSRRAKAKKAMAPYRMQPTDAKGKGVAPAESGVKRERPTEVIDLLDSSDEEEPVGGTMPSGCVGASTSGVKKGPDSWNYPNLLPDSWNKQLMETRETLKESWEAWSASVVGMRAPYGAALFAPFCPSTSASCAAPGNDGEVHLGYLSYQQVTGIRYYQGKETLKPKDEVVLKREPTNNFDQNAIAVHTSKASNPPSHISLFADAALSVLSFAEGGIQVGHINRGLAKGEWVPLFPCPHRTMNSP